MPLSSRPQRVLDWSRSREGDAPFGFVKGAQTYQLKHPDGRVELSTLDWDDALLRDLEACVRDRWDGVAAQRMGERLRGFLEATAGGREALAASALGAALVIRAMAAELLALPWGLCLSGSEGRRLGDLGEASLALAWPGVAPPPQGGGRTGARALLVWSRAGGRVPAAAHVEALARAWGAAGLPFDEARDVVANATLETLGEALETGEPPAVLHLLAHGGRAGEVTGIWLGDELVSPDRLAARLARSRATLRLVVLAVCRGAEEGALGNPLGSVGLALHRAGLARVVGARAPLTVAGSVILAQRLYAELLGGPNALEVALARAARELDEADRHALTLFAAPGTPADARPVALRPFRGLLPFQPSHRALFFGRDAEIQRVHAALAHLGASGAPRLLFVTGASGSGKSSLVLAGVLGRLLDNSAEEARALSRLREELSRLARRVPDPAISAAAAQLERAQPLGGARSLRPGQAPEAALAQAEAATGPSVLVVDQLEELFTHVPEAARQPFVNRLLALATGPAGVTVLVTLRVDMLGRLGELVGPTGSLDRLVMDPQHQVYVAAPDAAALRLMIAGPALRVGLTLEPALVERLLGELVGEPGVLPLLSQVLDALWLRREDGALRLSALDALGGVRGALGRHADETLGALDAEAKDAARALLVRLIEPGQGGGPDLRRRVHLKDLRAEATQEALIHRLVEARLLVRDEVNGEATLELVHEALITGWPTLGAWVEADRGWLMQLRQVERWAEDWTRHGALLDARRLGYAEELAKQTPRALPEDVAGLIHTSRAALDAERAREAARALALESEARRARDALRLMEARQPEADGLDRARLLLAVEDRAQAPGWAQRMVELLVEPLIVARYGSADQKVTHARFGPGGVYLAFWDGRIVKVGDDGAQTALRPGDGSFGVGRGGAILAFAVDPTSGALAWQGRNHMITLHGRAHEGLGRVLGLSWTAADRLRALDAVSQTVHEYIAEGRVGSTPVKFEREGLAEGLSVEGRHVVVRAPLGLLQFEIETGHTKHLPGESLARFSVGVTAQEMLGTTASGELLLWDTHDDDDPLAVPALVTRLRAAPQAPVRDLTLSPYGVTRGALTVSVRGVARRWSFDRALRWGRRLGTDALAHVRIREGRIGARSQRGRCWVLDTSGRPMAEDERAPMWNSLFPPWAERGALALRADDERMVIYAHNQLLLVHRDPGTAWETIYARADDATCAAFLPDGSVVIGLGGLTPLPPEAPDFKRFGPSGLTPWPLPGHEGASGLAFDTHGGVLSSHGGELRLSRPGWPRLRLEVPEGVPMSLALDGGLVVAGCSDGVLWGWTLPPTPDDLATILSDALSPQSNTEE